MVLTVKDIEIDEDKGKKRHLNVVFIGHVGMFFCNNFLILSL